jgi:hypothetical protein
MENQDHYSEGHMAIPAPKKNSFWRKLGGGSLTVSIIVHAILLALAAIWIIRIIPPPKEKIVDFMPAGGGGGNPASQERSLQKQKASVMKPSASRIAVSGAPSAITLPDMDVSSQLSSLSSLSSGAMSGGLGGSGSGGGRGDGMGTGFGSGTGPGAGMGTGTANPFGVLDANANALEGTFYDFKQNRRKRPTDMNPDKLRALVPEFVNRGWRESFMHEYFAAPRKLYQTKIYMPNMSADSAPAAFEVEKEVQPTMWMVVYRGTVVAPKTGKFRFVGAGDDLLIVRFNGKNVFDHGYTLGTIGRHVYKDFACMSGSGLDKDLERKFKRDFPVKLPVKFHQYPTTVAYNDEIGGLAEGAEFEVVGGKPYPIEILISEIPGGRFCAALLIEEIGATYNKASNGSPIYHLFRTDSSLPKTEGDNVPPFDPSGPIWKVQKSGGGISF